MGSEERNQSTARRARMSRLANPEPRGNVPVGWSELGAPASTNSRGGEAPRRARVVRVHLGSAATAGPAR